MRVSLNSVRETPLVLSFCPGDSKLLSSFIVFLPVLNNNGYRDIAYLYLLEINSERVSMKG